MDKRLLDKEWRMSHLYKITDKQAKKIRFIRNRAQEHFNKNKHSRNIILKSRQLGITTDECIDGLDDVLFNRDFTMLLVAHKKEDAQAIFETKINYAWSNLPEQLQVLWGVSTESKNELKFDFGDGTQSSFRVSTSGRSATLQRVHISEFGKICAQYPHKAKEILNGTIPAVPMHGRVDIESTAEGQEGLFYEMFIEALNKTSWQPTEYKAHFYNWTWDDLEIASVTPIKDLPKEFKEYQEEHKLTDQQVSYYYLKWLSLGKNWYALRQEYPTTWEDAFSTSVEGAYYLELIQKIEANNQFVSDLYDPTLPVDTWWDLGGHDATAIWFSQQVGNDIRLIDCYSNEGEGMSHYIDIVQNKPYTYNTHNAPHDIEVKEYTRDGVSRWEIAKSKGITFRIVPKLSIEDGIEAVRSILSRCYFDKDNCMDGISALRHYRKEWDEKYGVFKSYPRHDEFSHFADSFRYLAVGLTKPRSKDQMGYDTERIVLK